MEMDAIKVHQNRSKEDVILEGISTKQIIFYTIVMEELLECKLW